MRPDLHCTPDTAHITNCKDLIMPQPVLERALEGIRGQTQSGCEEPRRVDDCTLLALTCMIQSLQIACIRWRPGDVCWEHDWG